MLPLLTLSRPLLTTGNDWCDPKAISLVPVKITTSGRVTEVGLAFDSNTNRLDIRMHGYSEIPTS